MVGYYFDSYALIELTKGSENYKPYIYTEGIFTFLNLIECYHSWFSELGEEKANFYFSLFKKYCVPVVDDDIKKGVKLRIQMRNQDKFQKPSFADCIGYVIALRFGVKFLTGDNAFKNMENVEFVK
ncbi:type II toxin-antitoxin system VapC family toxin [Candidatus Woesearchaeota archaeon]|nr:type II toxin-antitoxin system VapC family toxin [Candidatus Woesearchaeota archaeon]